MRRIPRWSPGLIPLLLLLVAAVGIKVPEIRRDLAARTAAAVSGMGPAAIQVDVQGRDVALSGVTFAEGERTKAIAAAGAVDGVRRIAGNIDLPPEAKPFAFSAERAGGRIVLTGETPDARTRARLVAAAKDIAADVDDQTRFARGAAPDFETWALAALKPLENMRKGLSALSDSQLSVAAEASNTASYRAALAALSRLPAGMSLAVGDIRPPVLSRYVWSASSGATGVSLDGATPSLEARSGIMTVAHLAFPGRTVTDHMESAGGAPTEFPAYAGAALNVLSRLASGKAILDGTTLTVVGEAPTPAAYAQAMAALKALPPGLALGRADIVPPVVSPYEWSARRDGERLILQGFTPSEAARDAIVDAAKAGNPGPLIDQMEIARGAPPDFEAVARAALAALGRLASGRATLTGLNLAVAGTLREGADAKTLAALFRDAPGVRVSTADVVYPDQHPYVFSATKDSGGALALGGFVPSDVARATVLEAARRAGSLVSGTTNLASGLPPTIDFDASIALGFAALAKLRSGEMKLEEDGLTVRGFADPTAVEELRALLSYPPAGVRLKLADLTASGAARPAPPAPPKRDLTAEEKDCQQRLSDRIAKENIKFRTGSADIERESGGVVEDLSRILLACPAVRVEVAGHSDNLGSPETNRELSLARAKSVASALAAAGVPADRMTPAGYGDERPIASNDTREGRAANRRTEFVVK